VLSEARRPGANAGVVGWYGTARPTEIFLSVLVVGEIRQGIERVRSRDPRRGEALEEWLRTLQTSYRDRILDVTAPVAEAWGRLRATGPLPVIDSLLAATALVHGLIVVTRDVAPFERVGVPWLNPWDA